MRTKPFSVELSGQAEGDFDKTYEFYYENNPIIANTFYHSIKLSLENIKENPITFPIAHKDLRKYALKSFHL